MVVVTNDNEEHSRVGNNDDEKALQTLKESCADVANVLRKNWKNTRFLIEIFVDHVGISKTDNRQSTGH